MKKLLFIFLLIGSMDAMAQSRTSALKRARQKQAQQDARRGAAAYQGVFYGNTTMVKDRSYYSANQQYYFRFQGDGNLVVYRADGQSLWSSGTENRGQTLIFQGDGNLVMRDAAGSVIFDAFANQALKNLPPATATESVLSQKTRANRTALVMQDDGNLVIYSGRTRVVKWSSDSYQK